MRKRDVLLWGGLLFVGGGSLVRLMQGNVNGQVISALLFGLVIVGWTASYLLRVFTGRMAFNEQVELFKDAQLQNYLDQLSPDELAALEAELAADDREAATE